MGINQILFIVSLSISGLLFFMLIALYMISRRSQHVMNSLLTILLQPERAKIQDAARVLHVVMNDEVGRIDTLFKSMDNTLQEHINHANDMRNELTLQNEKLINLANDAINRTNQMTQNMENVISGLQQTVDSDSWKNIETSTDKFMTSVNDMLTRVDETTQNTNDNITKIVENIDKWIASGTALSEQLQNEFIKNTEQMQTLTSESENMKNRVSELATTTADGFENIKNTVGDYESVLNTTDKLLDSYLSKMDNFSKQSKKELTNQMNTMTNTANVVAAQVRLAESSVDKQINKLTSATEIVISSASNTENSVRGISNELTNLTNSFNKEIKEFSTDVLSELKSVSGVANKTLESTKNAANAFSDSVKTMATGVRQTLIEMNTAHAQLSGQSENLIKMSAETTAQLQPLSALIEKYFSALPELSNGSVQASKTLEEIVSNMNEKIKVMKQTVSESTQSVSESAAQLDSLAGQSRQQMIDLMSDYAKAVDTMQTLNKQMMVARASAPMDAIKQKPVESYGHISSSDFLAQTEQSFEKIHELSLDLIKVAGIEIPDIVWQKYHNGDKTVFSKWLAKVLDKSDKKQIRNMLKSDAVFRSQATQFIRSFDSVLSGAKYADNSSKLIDDLSNTDLGHIYNILSKNV